MTALAVAAGLLLYVAISGAMHVISERVESNREYYDACQDWLSRNKGDRRHGDNV